MEIAKLNKDLKSIWSLSWPVIVGMLLQSLLGTVDLKFISMIGTTETAAASIGNSTAGVIFVMSALVASGTVAIISRAFGENNREEIKRIAGQAILLAAVLGGGIGWICSQYTRQILQMMFQPEASVLTRAAEYLTVIFAGTVFVFLNSTIRSILQALGDTKTPLYIFGVANVVNIILDPLLMFNFGYGVKGAAIATVFSNAIAFLIITYLLIKKLYEKGYLEFIFYMRLHLKDTLRIMRIGIWSCLQQISRPITGMIMFKIVNDVGLKEGVAAFGVGGQLFNYTFILLAGISVAISVMVGQSLGRRDIHKSDEIIREGLKLSVMNVLFFAIPYVIFPKYIIGFFSADENVIRIGIEYLRIVYIGISFVVFQIVYGGAFQGAGDTFPPMMASLVANVGLKLPLAYIFANYFHMGTDGVWWAISLSVVIESAILWYYFRKGEWKTKQV